MAPQQQKLSTRFEAVVALLASDKPGEQLAALNAADRMLRAQGVDGVAAALRAMFTTALRRDEKPEPQPKPEQQSEAKREPNLQNCTAEELRSQIEKIGGKVSAKSAARFKEIATKLFEAVREHDIHIHASGVAFLKSASRDDLTWTPKQQKFLCDLEERIGAELDWGADA